MKIADIKNLTSAELSTRRRELKNELFHLRLQQQGGQLENPALIRQIRREIARVETIATQKARPVATPAAVAK